MKERYPYSYNKNDRYHETYPPEMPERFAGRTEGGIVGWSYPGYNPNHQSTRTEKPNLRSENLTLKPY